MDHISLLHIYAGPSFHMDGYIVGNRTALESLRDAINRALLEGDGNHNASITPGVFTADGEGYQVVVIRQDTPLHETWSQLALPYTDEDGRLQIPEDALWPYDLLTKEDIRRLNCQGKTTVEEDGPDPDPL